MLIQHISVITLHQHYFPADGKRCMEEAGERIRERRYVLLKTKVRFIKNGGMFY